MENMEIKKSTPLSKNIWFSLIVFGLIGQIAWIVENMYFATFAQRIFEDTAKFGNLYFVSTTLMVIFSALTATIATIFAGGLSDRLGKRKVFITWGYIIWGVTIMAFALIPLNFSVKGAVGVLTMLVLLDCVMTFFGASANDAAFNSWVVDMTDVTNRGKVNSILSVMPIFATVVAVVVAMFTFDKGATNSFYYKLFFMILGIIPMIFGVISIFTIKDSPNLTKSINKSYLKDTFYGFKKSVIKENKMLYVVLITVCIIGVSQQVFMAYLLNFIINTLGITNYIPPFAIVIVLSAAITGLMGIVFDKKGRKPFYIPCIIIVSISLLVIYLMKFMPQSTYLPLLLTGGSIMLGATLTINTGLMSAFQDYLPKGYEGRFQGVRMCFIVLLPMIIGPLVSLALGINTLSASGDTSGLTKPPFEFFLAASIISVFALVPVIFVVKDADRLRESLIKNLD